MLEPFFSTVKPVSDEGAEVPGYAFPRSILFEERTDVTFPAERPPANWTERSLSHIYDLSRDGRS